MTVTAEERRRAQEDGYVECSECGAPIEQHDVSGFDDGSGKTCTTGWSTCEIENYRQACGLPRKWKP